MAFRPKLARYTSHCCEQVMPVPVIPVCTATRRIPQPLYELPPLPPIPTTNHDTSFPIQSINTHSMTYHFNPFSEIRNPVQPLPDFHSYAMIAYTPSDSSESSPSTKTNYEDKNIHITLRLENRPTGSEPIKIMNYPPSEEPISGTILTNTSGIMPNGYLPCDGMVYPQTTYPTLFSAIGTTYGEEVDSTMFTIPDLKDPNGAWNFYIIKI